MGRRRSLCTKLVPLLVTFMLVQSMALVVDPASDEPPEPEDHPIVRWTVEVADPTNGTGRESTLALDSQDRPHIAHFDHGNVSLRYTTKVGGSWATEVVDDSDLVGEFPSIAVDSQDRVHISYAPRQPLFHIPEDPPPPEPMIKALRYAVKTNSGWEKHIVWGPWAASTSLALDSDDQPHISYTSWGTGAVYYATRDGAGWRHEEVDPEGFLDNAIAVDSEGNPHIAYARYAYGCTELYYAKWNGSSWEKENIGLGGVILTDLALAIDEFDRRHLVWDGKDGMRYAIWNGSWVIQDIGTFHTSLVAITLQDNSPRMFYQSMQDKYGVLEEGTWEWETINTTEKTGVGITASHPLAIDGSGVPHLSAIGVFGWKACLVYVTRNPLSAGPVADAGHDQTVNEGDTVQFDGTGSHVPDSGQEAWVNVSNIPTTRFAVAGAVLDDELYVIGGSELPGFNETDAVEKYDPATDSWSSETPIFEPHVHMGAGAANGKLYAMGGFARNESRTTNLELDPATHTWINKTPMPFARHNHAVAVVNDKIYLIGGSNSMIDCPTLNRVDEYDPAADTWTQKADMPSYREGLTATVHDDKIYAIGGHAQCPGDSHTSQVKVEVYDPATDTWTSVRSLPTGRTDVEAETLGGKIFAMGGWNYTMPRPCESIPARSTTFVYDPMTDSWSPAEPMLETRSRFASGVVNGRIYVAAGHSNGWMWELPPPEWSEKYGPGSGELEYEWDFDDGADSDGNGNSTDDVDATGPTPAWTYGDDGDFTVTLKVTDELGTWDTMNVTVLNVAPEVSANYTCTGGGPADVMLRIAGEKWHDVTFAILEDGKEIFNETLVRVPGSPNEQMIGLEDFAMNGSRSYSIVAYYTPEDDPVNGQIWGATPTWIIMRSGGNETARLHHTFNVRHPQTWLWRVDDLGSYLPSRECVFTAYASDPGSGDLTFEWDFGDGATAEHVHYNDGIGPDPFPSPEINPANAADEARHGYASAGSYTVTLTVTDDDGGASQVTLMVDV